MKSITLFQKKSLEKVRDLSFTKHFYLAGGTALALKYNHRFSEDFDFFLFPDKSFNLGKFFFTKVKELKKFADVKVEMLEEDTVILAVDGIKFSFFKYPYKLLRTPIFNESLKIFIASDEDIACMKVVAISQRGAKRDFYDLWFLMKKHNWTLNEIERFVQEKYESILEIFVILKALTFFKDAENQQIEDIDKHWNEIKDFFIKSVKSFVEAS